MKKVTWLYTKGYTLDTTLQARLATISQLQVADFFGVDLSFSDYQTHGLPFVNIPHALLACTSKIN